MGLALQGLPDQNTYYMSDILVALADCDPWGGRAEYCCTLCSTAGTAVPRIPNTEPCRDPKIHPNSGCSNTALAFLTQLKGRYRQGRRHHAQSHTKVSEGTSGAIAALEHGKHSTRTCAMNQEFHSSAARSSWVSMSLPRLMQRGCRQQTPPRGSIPSLFTRVYKAAWPSHDG